VSALSEKARPHLGPYSGDLIHAGVVIAVCIMATVYSVLNHDHSNNVWIVYGSSIAYAAGRAGTRMFVGNKEG
jgi:hypothetical protein